LLGDPRLRVVLDALPFEVVLTTAAGDTLLNDAARRATGLPADAAVTRDRLNLLLEHAITVSRAPSGPRLPVDELPLERALRGYVVDADLHITTRPGRSAPDLPPSSRMVTVHARPVVERGAITGAVMTLADADEVHRDNDRLRRQNEQLTAVARAVRAILRGQDGRAAIVEAATVISGARGVTLFEPDGVDDLVCTASTGADLIGLRVPRGRGSVLAEAFDTGRRIFLEDTYADSRLDTDLHDQISELFGTRIGCGFWVPVVDSGRCLGVLIASFAEPVDITRTEAALGLLADEAALALAHERLVLELERLSGSDPLTGAVNRRSWDEALSRELPRAARDGRPVSVLMLDVDRFKTYNDRHGHAAGDVLLREAVRAWAERLRPTDVLCRWGGDEFAILLPGCELADAAAIAEELRVMVLANTSCSVGVAQWDGVEPATALLQRADAELYRAKTAGRDQVRVAAQV
jgi:diguanylate cyclase (GGDEF)-like protein